MNAIRLLQTIALFLVLSLGFSSSAQAQIAAAKLTPLIDALTPGSFKNRAMAIDALAATGDPRAVPVLRVLLESKLYVDEASGKTVFTARSGGKGVRSDPVTGKELPALTDVKLDKVNNSLRRTLRTAIGQMSCSARRMMSASLRLSPFCAMQIPTISNCSIARSPPKPTPISSV
ncbi:MAG: HEAT repeat domain-containing protein [Candidatus Devosia euplotis]|nr:HEAT repeat domain-containing protein [Candidatus Devosia euplotis]